MRMWPAPDLDALARVRVAVQLAPLVTVQVALTVRHMVRDRKAASGEESERIDENEQQDDQRETRQAQAHVLVYDLSAAERVAERRAVAHREIVLLVLDLGVLHGAFCGRDTRRAAGHI